ncbi:MAG: hypothetical protein KY428_07310 [Bacteroidetes bacterium]|nr:hypothetical protein [Bacteroidota bacterium]
MDKKYIDIRVEGNEDNLKEFIKMCGMFQYLGGIGSSREMTIFVDGDGSARFNFEIAGNKIPAEKLVSQDIDGKIKFSFD